METTLVWIACLDLEIMPSNQRDINLKSIIPVGTERTARVLWLFSKRLECLWVSDLWWWRWPFQPSNHSNARCWVQLVRGNNRNCMSKPRFNGHGVFMWHGFANVGYRCLYYSRPMNFNKRRDNFTIAYWRTSQSWITLPHIFSVRISSEKHVWATSAYQVKSSQVASLRLPRKWDVFKEGQRRQRKRHKSKKDISAARLCFLNYFAYLRPAANCTDSELFWGVLKIRG
jgi:hypothetical protein